MANSKLRCNQCKDYYPREQIIRINSGNYCSDRCVLAFCKANRSKANATIKKHEKKEHKKKLDAVKPLKHWLDLTQTAFNKMRVLQEILWFKEKGLEPECISCGKNNMDWCCGHFKSRGASSELRFDEKNTYLQCNRYCNLALSGNISGNKTTRGYLEGLKQRFGANKAKEIIDYCETPKTIKKWTMEDLKELRTRLYKEIRILNKAVNDE